MPWRCIFLTVNCLMLTSCVSLPREVSEPDQYEVRLDENRIIYQGAMSNRGNREVARLLRQEQGRVDWLDIESEGGNVLWGLDLGELVLEHELNVRVIGRGCHSSCANYVFPAGQRKVIEPGAVVAWHGSALQRRWGIGARLRMIFIPTVRNYFAEWRERQQDFYDRIGLDGRITIVGQDLGCRCTWALSKQDMALFGLTNVSTPDDYFETDLPDPLAEIISFLELPDNVLEKIRPR